MEAPRLAARTALVCLALAACAPRAWPVAADDSRPLAPLRPQSPVAPAQPKPVAGAGVPTRTQLEPATPVEPVAPSSAERLRLEEPLNSTSAAADGQANKRNKKKKKKHKTLLADCLAAHNRVRRLHNVPKLKWDDKLANFAQRRSDHIAASDGAEFRHPPDLPYGENLFWHSFRSTGCKYMVQSWYDEISLYNFDSPHFSLATGHFTQVVWRSTKRVGCAFQESKGPRGGLFLTCNYEPPGNWAGAYRENVPLPAGGGFSASNVTTTTTAATTTTVRPTGVATATTTVATTVRPVTSTPAATTKPKSKKKKKAKKKPASSTAAPPPPTTGRPAAG